MGHALGRQARGRRVAPAGAFGVVDLARAVYCSRRPAGSAQGIFQCQHPGFSCETGDAGTCPLEIQRSIKFVREQIATLPAGEPRAKVGAPAPDSFAVTLNEGWRGEICHVALTDKQGRFARYKIVDPSFHNWPALAYVLRDQEISDFPLINKSFNLSYCGHDL